MGDILLSMGLNLRERTRGARKTMTREDMTSKSQQKIRQEW